MRRETLAAVATVALALATWAAAEPLGPPHACHDTVQAFVEQDGKRTPLAGEVHLARRPFSLVMRSEDPPRYYVAASVDAQALDADLGAVFAPGHGAAEGDQDTDLYVNPSGVPPARYDWVFHLWYADNVHNRFSRLGTDPDGLIAARRDVGTLFLGQGHAIPPERWTAGPIHLVLTACPPGQSSTNPVRAVLLLLLDGPPAAPAQSATHEEPIQ